MPTRSEPAANTDDDSDDDDDDKSDEAEAAAEAEADATSFDNCRSENAKSAPSEITRSDVGVNADEAAEGDDDDDDAP